MNVQVTARTCYADAVVVGGLVKLKPNITTCNTKLPFSGLFVSICVVCQSVCRRDADAVRDMNSVVSFKHPTVFKAGSHDHIHVRSCFTFLCDQ